MHLQEFLREHLYQVESEGPWRLGSVRWDADQALEVGVVLDPIFATTPVCSRVDVLCEGVVDAQLNLGADPHDCGEFWMSDAHPLLDLYGPWVRMVAPSAPEDSRRLYANFREAIDLHYNSSGQSDHFLDGLVMQCEGAPHCGELGYGPKPLMQRLAEVAAHHGVSVKLEPAPAESNERPSHVVGFSNTYILCDRATVLRVVGELGQWAGIEPAQRAVSCA